jgi:2-keto-4-pentenoate hydratase
MPDTAAQAAALLLAARTDPAARLADLPEALRPADRAAAYAIQRLVAAETGAIGGWKVGAAGPEIIQCAPMPAAGVVASPATLSSKTHLLRGIEAEVAFRVGHDLPPRATGYTRDEVIAALATAHPAIELLESRYVDPDAVSVFTSLADSQVHGGFVFGSGRADWHGIDFPRETVEQYVDGALQMTHTGNPAGDMIRLVEWLANVGAVWAGGLKAGQFVTCGSWTGKTLVGETSTARVVFPSLGAAEVRFTV